jgi:glycyl-tRNA synthetase beta chain
MPKMSDTRDLLIEIGTEELPPKAVQSLSEAFATGIANGLQKQEITYEGITAFATPRRLAVMIKAVATMQPNRQTERRGPSLKAAFDAQGQATRAALGFAASCRVSVSELEKLETDKGSWLIYRQTQQGQATASLIPTIIENSLAALPIPKRMRWADLPYEFVRPVHWVLILFGIDVIETEIFGVRSGRETRGHRFHHPQGIVLTSTNDYLSSLENQAFVIPSLSKRRDIIRQLVTEAANELEGEAVIDDDLLNEVTCLIEYPVVITGSFDEEFLDVPAEALIAAMKGHQKYFHIVDSKGKLLPKFIAISNLQSQQPEVIRAGNERVIRPRLSDAAFFWKQDCSHNLDTHIEALKTVIFQKQLGSLYDKTERVSQLAATVAKQVGADELQAVRAAMLSKCDLMTEMVGEFPELQGIMGEYYARHDKETTEVAAAIREQYMPRFAGDELPKTSLGQALSISDKLDTVVGIFGIGQPPTGDKDPFGLRRASLGILRIIIECELEIDLQKLLEQSQATFKDIYAQTSQHVFDFMLERLRAYYQEKGFDLETIEAVLTCRPTSPLDIDKRIRGIAAFRKLPEAESLASANKRIHNILKKAKEKYPNEPDQTYFTELEERHLYDELETVNEKINPLIKTGNYEEALKHLASLREATDKFFDNVMVMAEDQTVRINRLAFLQKIRNLFLQIADISRL